MGILTDKLRVIYNQLSSLSTQFENINAKNLISLPNQIENMIIGENKMSLWINKSIISITEDDLNGVTEIKASAFYGCESLQSVTKPDSVTIIGGSAFYRCDSLQSVTIPDSVTSIGNSVFYGCESLTDIYLRPTTPPSLGNTTSIPNTTTIHVPVGCGDAYKSATNWSYHSSRIVEDIQPS